MQKKNKIEFTTFKGFGPSILKAKIPKDIVDKLNSYVDEIIVDKKKSVTLNHGNHLVGDVTQEFKVEENVREGLSEESENSFIKNWEEEYGDENKPNEKDLLTTSEDDNKVDLSIDSKEE